MPTVRYILRKRGGRPFLQATELSARPDSLRSSLPGSPMDPFHLADPETGDLLEIPPRENIFESLWIAHQDGIAPVLRRIPGSVKERGVILVPLTERTVQCLKEEFNYSAGIPDLERFRSILSARQYSTDTRRAYLRYTCAFLVFAGKTAYELAENDLNEYLAYLSSVRRIRAATANLVISAVSFFLSQIQGRRLRFERPSKDQRLPVVLSREEVARIVAAPQNPKHKLLLALIYGCGLRVSEASRLYVSDLDLDRRMVHIRRSKGRKDRYTILPRSLVPSLHAHIAGLPGARYLFPGLPASNPLSVRSIESIFCPGTYPRLRSETRQRPRSSACLCHASA
jgi:hypothetical protein